MRQLPVLDSKAFEVQDFIRTHDETLSVAPCVHNPDRSPIKSAAAQLVLVDMAVDLSTGKSSLVAIFLDRCNSKWVAADLRRPGSVGVS